MPDDQVRSGLIGRNGSFDGVFLVKRTVIVCLCQQCRRCNWDCNVTHYDRDICSMLLALYTIQRELELLE